MRRRRRWSSVTRIRLRAFVWGFADQGVSSGSTLLFTVAAGRILGPAGLGVVFIGFSSYLVALGLLRAFVVDPLIASSAVQGRILRLEADRAALSIVVLGAPLGAGVMVSAGLLAPSILARGLLLFAPWVLPALLHELVRSVLFRDSRLRLVTALDLLWLGTLVALIPMAVHLDRDWAVVGAWGAGGLVAATVGLASLGIRPLSARRAFWWWRTNALLLGRWLAAASAVYVVCTYLTVILLGFILGAADLGGLRAVLSAMTPLSLIVPALSLPGLPAISRAAGNSLSEARRLAAALGVVASLLASVYVVIIGLVPGFLGLLFGNEFENFSSLVWPLGLGQTVAAFSIGAILLLKAEQRGRAFFGVRSLASLLSLILPVLFALLLGLNGAAWGFALGAAVGSLLTVVVALSSHLTPSLSDPAPCVSST